MRSVTLASIFALVLSVSALPSILLDRESGQLEMIQSGNAEYFSDVLEKRQHDHEHSGEVDYSGYVCEHSYYSRNHIEKTVEKACKKIKAKSPFKLGYPKVFDPKKVRLESKGVKGGQYVYPILKIGYYSILSRARHHRVVVKQDCKFDGLVIQKKHRTWYTLGLGGKTQFHKCFKLFLNGNHN